MPGSEQVTPTKHAATGCEAGYRARERGARGKEGRRAGGTLVPRSCCQRRLNGSFHPRDPEGRRDVPPPLQMRNRDSGRSSGLSKAIWLAHRFEGQHCEGPPGVEPTGGGGGGGRWSRRVSRGVSCWVGAVPGLEVLHTCEPGSVW